MPSEVWFAVWPQQVGYQIAIDAALSVDNEECEKRKATATRGGANEGTRLAQQR
jgi:hypothetical protein